MFSSGGSSMGDMFGSKAMEASFKEFLARPENQPLVEKHQRREVKQAIQLQEKISALKFRDAVLESDYESQKAIAPFLRNRVLRKIIQTFANDEGGDFDKWAKNPRVLEMLREAKKLMDEGLLAEDEAEEYILRILRDPSYEHHSEFKAKSKQVARLPTDQLVQALNEHLSERRKGNAAYREGNYSEALQQYIRARSIVELVKGLSRADQAEVDRNRVAVACNIAAVHLATKDFGAAVEACEWALELDPYCKKALIRRIKAYLGRHEFDSVQKEIEKLYDLDPTMPEIAELQAESVKTKKAVESKEKLVFGNMFDRGSNSKTEGR